MTETARDIALAILALEEVVTTLRALSDDLNEPDTEPEPVWPTAPYVWHDGMVWVRAATGTYFGGISFWDKHHLNSELATVHEEAHRFAREAVPVVVVPAAEWEVFAPLARGSVTSGSFTLEAARDLVRAADGLGVAR